MVSLIGTWMQKVASGYLLYSLTGSVVYLGYVGFTLGLPSWLRMIYSGLIADRVPRRTLLIITQSIKMMLAFSLGGPLFLKWVQSAMIQSTVPDELRGRVTGTFALMYTGGEPLGALVAGLLADRTGESFTFYVCSMGMMLFAILIWFYRPEVRRMD